MTESLCYTPATNNTVDQLCIETKTERFPETHQGVWVFLNGNPLQCSCLENPRDGGAWWAAVHGVAQSRTRLKRLSSSSSSPDLLICPCIINTALLPSPQQVSAD